MARDLREIVGAAQLYVDLWMEADFFASDYLRALDGSLALPTPETVLGQDQPDPDTRHRADRREAQSVRLT